eukprot:g4220.t1
MKKNKLCRQFAISGSCSYGTRCQHQWLPYPKGSDVPFDDFSEERAWVHIDAITSFGTSRTVGSRENEELTPKYIKEAIHAAAAESGGKHYDEMIEKRKFDVDVQSVSGSFFLDFLGGFANAYQEITNVVVRLRAVDADENDVDHLPSVLINAHFDSALGTVAASDDVFQVAVMLEVFRNLLHTPGYDDVNFIFLFNGAEETILQGSHGFTTQHPWASSVKAVINLEAAGSGGREVLFQTGPGNPWISAAYAENVPFPHGSSLYEDAFRTGLIPSDTDFRIFRDHGRMVGVDLAIVEDGWAYHTAQDSAERLHLRPGSVQRCGENVLALAKALASAPELKRENSEASIANTKEGHQASHHHLPVAFFDVAGLFMVVVPLRWLRIATGLLLIGTFATWFRRRRAGVTGSCQDVSFSFVTLLFALLGAIISPVLMGAIVSVVAPLKWYANPMLVIPLFFAPSLAAILFVQDARNELRRARSKKGEKDVAVRLKRRLENDVVEDDVQNVARLVDVDSISPICFFAMLSVCLGITDLTCTYLPVLFFAGGFCSYAVGALAFPHNAEGRTMCAALCSFPPFLLGAQLLFFAFDFFLPLMGRSGTETPTDLIIAALSGLSTFILTTTTTPLLLHYLSKRARKCIIVVSCVLAIFGLGFATLVLSPYSSSRPKRVYLQHCTREWYANERLVRSDSGLWVNGIDFYGLSPISYLRGATSGAASKSRDSIDGVGTLGTTAYGDAPWYLPIMDMIEGSWYLQSFAGAPILPPNESSDFLKNSFEIVVTKRAFDYASRRERVYFRASGSNHMTVYVSGPSDSPESHGYVLGWSLYGGVPVPAGGKGHGASSSNEYFIFFASGRPDETATFEFWVDFRWQEPSSASSSSRDFRVAAAAHFVDIHSEAMDQFLRSMPTWTTSVGWVSLWKGLALSPTAAEDL